MFILFYAAEFQKPFNYKSKMAGDFNLLNEFIKVKDSVSVVEGIKATIKKYLFENGQLDLKDGFYCTIAFQEIQKLVGVPETRAGSLDPQKVKEALQYVHDLFYPKEQKL